MRTLDSQVNEQEYEILKDDKNTLNLLDKEKYNKDDLKTIVSLKEKGCFSSQIPTCLSYNISWEKIVHKIKHKRNITTIELTSRCNLRCAYCPLTTGFLDGRKHENIDMSFNTLKQAIDDFLKCSDEINDIGIFFYGGEPLLAFKLLQRGVNYCKCKSKNKKIQFSVTTNGTLINLNIAKYLKKEGFTVLVSLDGPKSMNDIFRVYPDRSGSFSHAIRGLKILLDVYGLEDLDKLGVSMVMHSPEWLPIMENFWTENPFIPKSITTIISKILKPPNLNIAVPNNSYTDISEFWMNALISGNEIESPITRSTCVNNMLKIMNRCRYKYPINRFYPNGCCIPGGFKIFVDVYGNYHICEKAYGVPPVGSVHRGVNISCIKKIIDEYAFNSIDECKSCIVLPNCSICFIDSYSDGKFDAIKKKKRCELERNSFRSNLEMFSVIGLVRPEKLEEWKNLKIQ